MSSDGIQRATHAPHRPDEIGEPFEREVLAVQRDQHRIGGDEPIQRQQAERRRAIDEDVVVVGAQRVEHPLQPALAIGKRDELDFGAGEVLVRGNEGELFDTSRLNERFGRAVGQERFVRCSPFGTLDRDCRRHWSDFPAGRRRRAELSALRAPPR